MSDLAFKDKFIGFVDILGFKKLVEATESETGMSLNNLLGALKELGISEGREKCESRRPRVCPCSTYISHDLDFRLIQISDCVIVSSEVSPAGEINLVHHCWGPVIRLLTKGIMCRGYITRGLIYHTNDQVIGSGYQKAYEKESQVNAFKREADERGTPFIEVDPVVCNYVETYGDLCVKMVFARLVKTDGEVTALFPFQCLAHSFSLPVFVGNPIDLEKETQSNQGYTLWDRVPQRARNGARRSIKPKSCGQVGTVPCRVGRTA